MILTLLPAELSHLEGLGPGSRLPAFTLLVALCCGLAFGIFPALRASGLDLGRALKQNASSSSAPQGRVFLRQVLVAGEVTLVVTLLVAAGLLAKSFVQLQRSDIGFPIDRLLTLRIELPEKAYEEESRQLTFFGELMDRVHGLGDRQIEGATLMNGIGTDLQATFAIPEVEGRPAPDPGARQPLLVACGIPGMFETLGIPLQNGRGFSAQDEHGAEPVVVINRTMAGRWLPGQDPVGHRIRIGEEWLRIVGVAGDVFFPAVRADSALDQQLFRPFDQSPGHEMSLALRLAPGADVGAVISSMKDVVWAIDPLVPVSKIATGRQLVVESLDKQRFSAALMVVFAAIAAFLTMVGIYGVVAYSVCRRRREIGIRLALGAGTSKILSTEVRRGFGPVVVGTVVGLGAAALFSRTLASLLEEVGTNDPATYGAVALLVAVVAIVAVGVPALRAARVDPMTVLRDE